MARAKFFTGSVGHLTHHSEPASRDDGVCELLPAAAEANVGGAITGGILAVSKKGGRVRFKAEMRRRVFR